MKLVHLVGLTIGMYLFDPHINPVCVMMVLTSVHKYTEVSFVQTANCYVFRPNM
jgi:hypothetical protein